MPKFFRQYLAKRKFDQVAMDPIAFDRKYWKSGIMVGLVLSVIACSAGYTVSLFLFPS